MITAMTSQRDQRIDFFLKRTPDWQRTVFSRARKLIHTAEPEIGETIKRTSWPFFVLSGNVCAFQSTKDHANIYIYDPIAPDPSNICTDGGGNATGRLIKIYRGDTLDEAAFKKLIQAVATNNRAGGWRKLQSK